MDPTPKDPNQEAALEASQEDRAKQALAPWKAALVGATLGSAPVDDGLQVNQASQVDQGWQSLCGRLDSEAAGWAQLKSYPTWLRTGVLWVSWLILGAISIALFGFGPHMAQTSNLVWLGAFLAVAAWAHRQSSSVYIRPPSRTLFVPLALAFFLPLAPGVTALLSPGQAPAAMPDPAPWMCLGLGAVTAVPLFVLGGLMHRGGSGGSLLLAGVTAGLAGAAVLHTECAATGLAHLALGHVSILLSMALLTGLVGPIGDARRDGSTPGSGRFRRP